MCTRTYWRNRSKYSHFLKSTQTHSRFNDDGPWPSSLQNLEEGKNLLLEANDEHEKELINLAINSIKNSL